MTLLLWLILWCACGLAAFLWFCWLEYSERGRLDIKWADFVALLWFMLLGAIAALILIVVLLKVYFDEPIITIRSRRDK